MDSVATVATSKVPPSGSPVRLLSKLLSNCRSHMGGPWGKPGGRPGRRAIGLVAGLQEAERFRVEQVVPAGTMLGNDSNTRYYAIGESRTSTTSGRNGTFPRRASGPCGNGLGSGKLHAIAVMQLTSDGRVMFPRRACGPCGNEFGHRAWHAVGNMLQESARQVKCGRELMWVASVVARQGRGLIAARMCAESCAMNAGPCVVMHKRSGPVR